MLIDPNVTELALMGAVLAAICVILPVIGDRFNKLCNHFDSRVRFHSDQKGALILLGISLLKLMFGDN